MLEGSLGAVAMAMVLELQVILFFLFYISLTFYLFILKPQAACGVVEALLQPSTLKADKPLTAEGRIFYLCPFAIFFLR
jgi:hypothetical protein